MPGSAAQHPPAEHPLGRWLLHLATLYALAVAQPILSLLAEHPELFVVRDVGEGSIVALALLLVALPPLPSMLLRVAAHPLSWRARRLADGVLLAPPIALLLLYAMGPSLRALVPGPWLPLAALAGAAGLALVYLGQRELRLFVTYLSPALVVVPAWFLFTSPALFPDASAALEPRVRAAPTTDTPVVFLLFDELSMQSLLAADGSIDGDRFPGFAELASVSTWYRNATAASDKTEHAVPALLSGRLPRDDRLPEAADHPYTLFSALEGKYRRVVSEIRTRLCTGPCEDPTGAAADDRLPALLGDLAVVYLHLVLPRSYAERLPPIDEDWGGFAGAGELSSRDYPRRLETFVAAIGADATSTLFFDHSHLPHRPYEFMPSGLEYHSVTPVLRLRRIHYPRQMEYVYRRYLAQLQLVDRLLGETLDRLRASGVLDRCLLVVTADHGPRYLRLPGVTGGELARSEWLFVPLFVKRPGEGGGRVVDRPASSVDVVPTILDELGMLDAVRAEGEWKLDGVPLDELPESRERRVYLNGELRPLPPGLEAERQRILDWKLATFGDGSNPDDLYHKAAPLPHLVGRALASLPPAPGDHRIVLDAADGPTRTVVFDPSTGRIPALVRGALRLSEGSSPPAAVAIAVGDVIRATAEPYLYEPGHYRFSVLLPEQALEEGENVVRAVGVE